MSYIYTQHKPTIQLLTTCYNAVALSQDRSKDTIEDILSQLPPDAVERGATLFAVLPLDKVIELKKRAPNLRVVLMQLDGGVIERITGQPYDPKREYDANVVKQALKLIEIKRGSVRYMTFDELRRQLEGKTVAVFNDTLRAALQSLIKANFVKTCSGGVEINPLGAKSGIRISFPPTAGRLTEEQMVEMFEKGQTRIYYLEVEAEEIPLQCE
jgi:hypothetical protein